MQTWHDVIGPLKQGEAFKKARQYVAEHRAMGEEIYPADKDVFNAFRFTPFDRLKVVIVGQDPYHEPGQAMGLSFSVPPGVTVPPSLANIYKELQSEFADFVIPEHGCLIPWAEQGVLLLNSVLTVERGKANSHKNIGWAKFTDDVISAINEQSDGVVFMLWGRSARIKCQQVDRNRHLVLEAAHPSPLSAYNGFFGCGHFRKANRWLQEHGKAPVIWQLPPVWNRAQAV